MYRHILIAVDGSEFSQAVIDHAVALASAVGARVTGVHAVAEYSPPVDALFALPVYPTWDEYKVQATREAEQILAGMVDTCRKAGIECMVTHGIENRPYRLILDTARDRGCDLICMSSHGRRGLSALLLGSETQKVLTHGKLPVLVVRAA